MDGQHKDDDSDKATIDRTFGKLRVLASRKLNDSTTLYGLAGSILDYQGDAMVNAANTGGVTGFGVDERVNRAGGPQLKQARRALQGIPTGTCKSTPSFDHVVVQWIIHAVGPVLRDNALSGETTEAKLEQLAAAYYSCLQEATRLQCKDIGFCLLSCGVFRGNVSLEECITQGLKGMVSFVKQKTTSDNDELHPTTICLIAYTTEEQHALVESIKKLDLVPVAKTTDSA